MTRILVLLAVIGIIALAVSVNRAPRPAAYLLDVPEMVEYGVVPARGASERKEGRLYWSACGNKHFSRLEVASFGPRAKPEIVTGEFLYPVTGRSEAMNALGVDDTYKVTDDRAEAVVHTGGPFAEFTLYRSQPYVDEYSGFFAATRVGLVNMEQSE